MLKMPLEGEPHKLVKHAVRNLDLAWPDPSQPPAPGPMAAFTMLCLPTISGLSRAFPTWSQRCSIIGSTNSQIKWPIREPQHLLPSLVRMNLASLEDMVAAYLSPSHTQLQKKTSLPSKPCWNTASLTERGYCMPVVYCTVLYAWLVSALNEGYSAGNWKGDGLSSAAIYGSTLPPPRSWGGFAVLIGCNFEGHEGKLWTHKDLAALCKLLPWHHVSIIKAQAPTPPHPIQQRPRHHPASTQPRAPVQYHQQPIMYTLTHLSSLGLRVKREKSTLAHRQQTDFLTLILNKHCPPLRQTADCDKDIHSRISPGNACVYQRVLGLLVAAATVLLRLLHTKPFQRWFLNHCVQCVQSQMAHQGHLHGSGSEVNGPDDRSISMSWNYWWCTLH